jgi:hypothetical protein
MATVELFVFLWIAAGQPVQRVGLQDLVADPAGYDGKNVQVRAMLWVGEEFSQFCPDRLNLDDMTSCQGVMPDRGTGLSKSDWDKFLRAAQLAITGKYRVWLTVRGRFEASDTPKWGVRRGYRFRIVIDKVLKVETLPSLE